MITVKPWKVTLRVKEKVMNSWIITAPTKSLAWLNFRYEVGFPEIKLQEIDRLGARYSVGRIRNH